MEGKRKARQGKLPRKRCGPKKLLGFGGDYRSLNRTGAQIGGAGGGYKPLQSDAPTGSRETPSSANNEVLFHNPIDTRRLGNPQSCCRGGKAVSVRGGKLSGSDSGTRAQVRHEFVGVSKMAEM